jgi:hypothetical protein
MAPLREILAPQCAGKSNLARALGGMIVTRVDDVTCEARIPEELAGLAQRLSEQELQEYRRKLGLTGVTIMNCKKLIEDTLFHTLSAPEHAATNATFSDIERRFHTRQEAATCWQWLQSEVINTMVAQMPHSIIIHGMCMEGGELSVAMRKLFDMFHKGDQAHQLDPGVTPLGLPLIPFHQTGILLPSLGTLSRNLAYGKEQQAPNRHNMRYVGLMCDTAKAHYARHGDDGVRLFSSVADLYIRAILPFHHVWEQREIAGLQELPFFHYTGQ